MYKKRAVGILNMISTRTTILNTLLMGLASTVTTNLAQGADSKNDQQRGNIEEVIVTAQKREERLQDVPISISVLGGESMERGDIAGLNDALRTVPGIAGYESSQSGMSKFSIRGVTSNPSLFNGSSTVGYYFDDVPFSFVRFPVSPDAGTYDLQRVEVLRGPQGTLYGANSLNGVVRVISNDTNLDRFQLSTRAGGATTKDGEESYRGDAMVNVPLIAGKLGVRATVGYAYDSGWIDQTVTPVKDVNDNKSKHGRIKLTGAPSENFEVELMAWLMRSDRGAAAAAFDDRTISARYPIPADNSLDVYSLGMSYDFEGFTATSTTSYLDLTANGYLDISNVDNLQTQLGARSFAEEIRFSSAGTGPWKWVAGALYRDATDRRYQDFLQNVAAPGVILQVYKSESFAAYGELTRVLLDGKLELTGGLRYFTDDTSTEELAAVTNVAPYGLEERSFSATTPRAVVTFHPSQNTTLYASYSQGFRPGFPLDGEAQRLAGGVLPPTNPDKLSNYELGAKGALLDGRFDYEVATYYVDWADPVLVSSTIVQVGTTLRGVARAFNGPTIYGMGVDAAMNVRPFDGWAFGLRGSWNNLQISEDVFSTNASGSRLMIPEGSRPAESPEYTVGADISYELGIGDRMTGVFSGGIDYASAMEGVRTLPAGAGFEIISFGEPTQARLSFALKSEAGWMATLFVDNLTDDNSGIHPAPQPVVPIAYDRLRPRTIGLQLDHRFK
jgi:outer membrane receptor protein involved in Fe transport